MHYLTNLLSQSRKTRALRSIAGLPHTFRRRRLFLEQLEDRRLLATFSVLNTDDSGLGSLRQAILDANANPGFDEVDFNIPGDGVHTIAPLTLLPSTHGGGPISIDATTQPGFDFAGPRLIELSGVNISNPNGSGLIVESSDSRIRGLAINGFGNGILIHGTENVSIQGNYIGLDPTGTNISQTRLDGWANTNGIGISASRNAIVGGSEAEDRNVISGNLHGIWMLNDASDNRIIGNYLGTDREGLAYLPNNLGVWMLGSADMTGNHIGEPGVGNIINGAFSAVHMRGPVSGNFIQANSFGIGSNGAPLGVGGVDLLQGASGNLIGGSTVEARNVFGWGGVSIRDGAHHNAVQGNHLGVDATGTQWIQTAGVAVFNGAYDNVIGTDGDGANDDTEGNVISGGVLVFGGWANPSETKYNVIAGNQIGTDATGTVALPHPHPDYRVGVSLETSFNRVGTNGDGVSDDLERNIISGGWEVGVRVTGADAQSNVIAGNYIGTDITGTAPLPNRVGVALDSGNNRLGTNGDGLNDAIEGNLISGNLDIGVGVGGDNLVAGNYIGTDATGLLPMGNGVGINLAGTGGTIGGTNPALRNVISGNSQSGIDTNNARDYTVLGNYIGVDKTGTGPLGNGADGIWLRSNSYDNMIGGTTPGAANIIAYNGRNGVSASEGSHQFGGLQTASGNSIRGNSIYANTGLGIDLGQYPFVLHNETPVIIPGVTPNDAADSDSGPNGFQNFPVLSTATWGAATRVQGTLHSTPNSTFVLDFYANATADPLGYGEGQRWLDTTTVVTDVDGNASFDVLFSAVTSAGESISGTATDAAGNTSEFSASVAANIPTNAPPTADAGADQIRSQGSVVSFDGTNSSDADGTIIEYAWDFGDGTTYAETAASASDGVFDGRTTHLYTDNGSFAVALMVTDNNAATAADTASVTLQNVAPTVDAGLDLSLMLGGSVTLNGAFNDPGRTLGETYMATIDWGDGQTTGGVVDVGAGTAVGSHVYATAGNYTVTLTVTDNGDPAPSQSATPLSGSDTTLVVVVRPVTVIIQPDSINLDSSGTLTVAIYGAADFDASQIDVGSVLFAGAAVWQSTLVDVNGDGQLDLQLKFRTQDTILDQIYAELLEDDLDADGILDSTRQVAEVAVTGVSQGGTHFSGSDDLTLFLAGRALRELLDELFAS